MEIYYLGIKKPVKFVRKSKMSKASFMKITLNFQTNNTIMKQFRLILMTKNKNYRKNTNKKRINHLTYRKDSR
jgi:hypothetical protein